MQTPFNASYESSGLLNELKLEKKPNEILYIIYNYSIMSGNITS